MNPSDWIYHLSMRAVLDRNGFLDPCSRTELQPRRLPRERPATRAAVVRVGVLVPLALLVPVALLVAAVLGG